MQKCVLSIPHEMITRMKGLICIDTLNRIQQSSISLTNNRTFHLHIIFDFSILSLLSSHINLMGMHWGSNCPHLVDRETDTQKCSALCPGTICEFR